MLLNDDFLLTTDWAKKLFHDHAEKMPIIDYHCHLDPQQIYEDKHFENLTEVWLYDHGAGDHYKWRLLRANGTDEKYITGDGDAYTKYLEFVKVVEAAPGNPIFEWSHAELRRVFGIDLTINQKNAKAIWDAANEQIAKPEFSAKGLIRKFNVKCICTTDNPASDLKWHKLLAVEEQENGFKVLPTFRPDDLLGIDLGTFADYAKTLTEILASRSRITRASRPQPHSASTASMASAAVLPTMAPTSSSSTRHPRTRLPLSWQSVLPVRTLAPRRSASTRPR